MTGWPIWWPGYGLQHRLIVGEDCHSRIGWDLTDHVHSHEDPNQFGIINCVVGL